MGYNVCVMKEHINNGTGGGGGGGRGGGGTRAVVWDSVQKNNGTQETD